MSRQGLADDIRRVLGALRRHSGGRYACLLERTGVLFESPSEEEAQGGADPALRRLLDGRREALFAIPAGLAGEGPMEDAFAGWEDDEFLLAFINGRVAVVVACPDAERARAGAFDLLKVLADRLFRYDSRFRLDERGRGLLFGRARIDVVAVGGQP